MYVCIYICMYTHTKIVFIRVYNDNYNMCIYNF